MGVKFEVGQRAVINNSFDYTNPRRSEFVGLKGKVSFVVDEEAGMLFFNKSGEEGNHWTEDIAVLASELDKLED